MIRKIILAAALGLLCGEIALRLLLWYFQTRHAPFIPMVG